MVKKLIIEKGGYRPTVSGPIEPPTSVRTTKQESNQIEKLVLQAHQNLCSASKEVEFNYNFADEFAKLIIIECVKVADDNYDKGFCPVGGFILEHFNIKP